MVVCRITWMVCKLKGCDFVICNLVIHHNKSNQIRVVPRTLREPKYQYRYWYDGQSCCRSFCIPICVWEGAARWHRAHGAKDPLTGSRSGGNVWSEEIPVCGAAGVVHAVEETPGIWKKKRKEEQIIKSTVDHLQTQNETDVQLKSQDVTPTE